jgi:hypothetical protein
MAVELSHRSTGFVVTIHDPAELPALGRVAAAAPGGAGTAIVVDVSGLTIAPPGAAQALVDAVRVAAVERTGQRWSLVANRLSARRVLRSLCAGTSVRVFPSVDMALAATEAA